jgi:hypothetical protein
MNAILKDFIASGRTLVTDTKLPKPKDAKPVVQSNPADCGDIHKVLVKRAVQEKPKKADLIKEFEKIIALEEAKL